jgi:hypothetical protein
MPGIYKGPLICQGCKRPGSEKSRWSKDQLCDECQEHLILGRELKKDFREKDYISLSVGWYCLEVAGDGFAGGRDLYGKGVDKAFRLVCKALHREGVKYHETIYIAPEATTSSNRYIIRREYAEPLKMLAEILRKQQYELRTEFNQVEVLAGNAVKKLKNKIYNEGVAKGKQLLIGLNNGTLSLSDFDKEIEKY